jgi:hypothetical protein
MTMPEAGCSFNELCDWLDGSWRDMREELYAAGRLERPKKRLKTGYWFYDDAYALGGYFVHDFWLEGVEKAV